MSDFVWYDEKLVSEAVERLGISKDKVQEYINIAEGGCVKTFRELCTSIGSIENVVSVSDLEKLEDECDIRAKKLLGGLRELYRDMLEMMIMEEKDEVVGGERQYVGVYSIFDYDNIGLGVKKRYEKFRAALIGAVVYKGLFDGKVINDKLGRYMVRIYKGVLGCCVRDRNEEDDRKMKQAKTSEEIFEVENYIRGEQVRSWVEFVNEVITGDIDEAYVILLKYNSKVKELDEKVERACAI